MSTSKNIPYEHATAFFEKLRAQGKKIVQCHGTFDLLHPGHIHHLEEAKELGDLLVVTITGERFVNKGPGRPYFNDTLRSRSLSALACVDYVVVIPHTAAVEAIECVRPHIYCKGVEYQNPDVDVTGNIIDDVKTVERLGGEVRYVGSVVFSSTKLLNNLFEVLPSRLKEFCRQVADSCPPDKWREKVEKFSKLKVVVVGDIIYDRYTAVRVQGLTSKATIVSGKFLGEETYAGGALAVVRHLQQFTNSVRLVSLSGPDEWSAAELQKYLPAESNLVFPEENFITVIKQRFVAPAGSGKELKKLFAVNYISDEPIRRRTENAILERIESAAKNADLVMVADFGHGLLSDRVRRYVQSLKGPFLSVNCQTNSYNHGFNLLTHRYRKVDCFSLDETELLLTCGRRRINFQDELTKISRKLRCKYAWLTRGGTETIGVRNSKETCMCLPFDTNVTDAVGAGDAFFSVVSLAACQGLPLDVCTFLGQLAGAQAVAIVGNARPISKADILKAGMSLLKF